MNVHMVTEMVESTAAGLALTGRTLAEDWQAISTRIFTEQTAVNANGRLEAAFLGGYTPPAHAARLSGDQLPGKFSEMATTGRVSMQGYMVADSNGAAGMPR